MLEKLKHKWKVNSIQLTLILCTFALGGSSCGYLGRKVLKALQIDNDIIYIFAYVIISIPLGQFTFFANYLKKIKSKIFGK
jgi:hypothetical protein